MSPEKPNSSEQPADELIRLSEEISRLQERLKTEQFICKACKYDKNAPGQLFCERCTTDLESSNIEKELQELIRKRDGLANTAPVRSPEQESSDQIDFETDLGSISEEEKRAKENEEFDLMGIGKPSATITTDPSEVSHGDEELKDEDIYLDGADFEIDPNFGDEDPDTEKPVDDSPEDFMEPGKAEAEAPQFLYREKIQEILSDFVGKIDFDNPEEVKIAREALNEIIKRSYQIHRGGSSFPKATLAERKRMFLLRELFGNNVYEHQTSLPEKTFLKFINAQGNPDRLEPSDREFLHRGKIIEILSYLPSINLDDKEGRKKAYGSLSKLMLRLWKISRNERMVVKADDVDRKNMRLLKKVFGENVFQSAYISFEDFKKAVSEKNPYSSVAEAKRRAGKVIKKGDSEKKEVSVLSDIDAEPAEPLEPENALEADDGLSTPMIEPGDVNVADPKEKETLLNAIQKRLEEKERKESKELYWQGLSEKEQKKMTESDGTRNEEKFSTYIAETRNGVRQKAGLSKEQLSNDDIDALINNGYYVDKIRNLLGLGWEIPNEYGRAIFVPRFKTVTAGLLSLITVGAYPTVMFTAHLMERWNEGKGVTPKTLKNVLRELKEESLEAKEERLKEQMETQIDREVTPEELQKLLAYEFKERKEKVAEELQKISTYELPETQQERVNQGVWELETLMLSDPVEKSRREKNAAMEQANLEVSRKEKAALEQAKVEAWREKKTAAKKTENLGACLHTLEQKLEVDSGASKKDLMDWVFAFADEFGFDSQEREQMEKIIDNSLAYREAAKYVMGRYSDTIALLHNLTGLDFVPADKEKCMVSRGPLSIDVVADADILELIRASGKSDKPCGNGFTRQVTVGRKKVFVTFTKRGIEDHQKTLAHEREHVKNKIFSHVIDRQIDPKDPESIAEEYQNTADESKAYILLRDYFFLVREKTFQRVKQEIFSILKDGRGRGYDSLFVGGYYDYLKDFRNKYASFHPSLHNGSFGELSGLAIQWKVFSDNILVTQYNDRLSEALDSLGQLKESGYSDKDAVAILRFVPLEKWNEYVGDLLATAA